MSDKQDDKSVENETVEKEITEKPLSVEGIAGEMGWRPKDEWDGDGEWRDAAEFIRKGHQIQKEKADDSRKLRKEIERMQETMRTLADGQAKQLKQAIDSAKLRLEKERDEAIEVGDKTKVKQVDSELKKLDEQKPEPVNDRQKAFESGFNDFKSRHPWYEKNKEMTASAITFGKSIADMGPVDADDYYELIEKHIKRLFPEEFTNPNRAKASPVSADKGTVRSNGSLWDKAIKDYPELNHVFQTFVNDGIYKDTKDARERYAKEVLGE